FDITQRLWRLNFLHLHFLEFCFGFGRVAENLFPSCGTSFLLWLNVPLCPNENEVWFAFLRKTKLFDRQNQQIEIHIEIQVVALLMVLLQRQSLDQCLEMKQLEKDIRSHHQVLYEYSCSMPFRFLGICFQRSFIHYDVWQLIPLLQRLDKMA